MSAPHPPRSAVLPAQRWDAEAEHLAAGAYGTPASAFNTFGVQPDNDHNQDNEG